MVDVGLETRVSPSYDPKRYLIGLDGPSTISGVSRPTSTKDSEVGPGSAPASLNRDDLKSDSNGDSPPSSVPADVSEGNNASVGSESSVLACSLHDHAHPFDIGFVESVHSSAPSVGSQIYLDPGYQEHVANLER